MKKFTFKSRYGSYQNCYFVTSRYGNGNLAVEIWNNTEGPISRITTNPDIKIPVTHIAIKNYAENEGMVETMKKMGIIESDPTQIIRTGYVTVPVHKLTSLGYEEFLR